MSADDADSELLRDAKQLANLVQAIREGRVSGVTWDFEAEDRLGIKVLAMRFLEDMVSHMGVLPTSAPVLPPDVPGDPNAN